MNNSCCDIKIAIMYRKDQNPQAQKWNDGEEDSLFLKYIFIFKSFLSPVGWYFGKLFWEEIAIFWDKNIFSDFQF